MFTILFWVDDFACSPSPTPGPGYSDGMIAFTLMVLLADKPLAGAVIVVDPGHGGQAYSKSYTGGTRGVKSKLTESELNLRVAKELVPMLRDAGAEVHLTRDADHRLSREGSSAKDELHARIDFFEHHNCHFFLSLHHNAGPATAKGHTTIYKHNAADDTLYEACAKTLNDALEGAMPGPKLKLIKGSYHIVRETAIPGTILEAGFQSNAEFDEISNNPDFAKREATAILKGAANYWAAHKPALEALRTRLAAERKAKPRDPKSYTAIALNPAFRETMAKRLATIEPSRTYVAADAAKSVTAFASSYPEVERLKFRFSATVENDVIKLTGNCDDRKYHDDLIDAFVAMKLFAIKNEIAIPKQ
jgi:N-acetylmuramoyl-L-alanine amidase